MQNKINKPDIAYALKKFAVWLEKNGYKTYDNNDIWSSSIGSKIKSLYLSKPKIGKPPLAFFHLLDVFIPSSRKIFYKKNIFSCALAEIMMGYLNLSKIFSDIRLKTKAIDISNTLIKDALKTDNGIGWGLPYSWVTPKGIVQKKTPNIVQTSHCFNGFCKIYNETKDEKYLSILKNISDFVFDDLKIFYKDKEFEPSKYGYNYPTITFNTIALRAAILMKSYKIFRSSKYKESAMKNILYLKKYQNDNGSWYYSHESKIIDNFHTAYILKSLFSAYKYHKNPIIIDIANCGFKYYKNNFFRKDKSLIHFSKNTNPKFRYIELLDYSEAIKLEIEIYKSTSREFDFANELVSQVISKYQTKKGYFVTRVNSLRIKNKIPYMRWPQAPLFNALSEYYKLSNLN